jgi:preprotein translocase subunit SecE
MARSSSPSSRINPDAARRAFTFRYFGEAFTELRRVTWPSRQETVRLSIMVIAVAIAVGIILGVIDLGFSRLMDVILGTRLS